MRTFRELAQLIEGTEIDKIINAFGDKLMPFLEELYFYIDENDKISLEIISKHKKELKKAGFLTSPKMVYRLVKLEKKEVNKKPKVKPAYSASTQKLEGKMLNLMKNMITSYKAKGDFYYLEIDDCEGLDINTFGKVIQDNKEKLLKINEKTTLFFLESIENKKEQNEFLIFGAYGVNKVVPA